MEDNAKTETTATLDTEAKNLQDEFDAKLDEAYPDESELQEKDADLKDVSTGYDIEDEDEDEADGDEKTADAEDTDDAADETDSGDDEKADGDDDEAAIDSDLQKRAIRAGLDPDDFKNAASLERVLTAIEGKQATDTAQNEKSEQKADENPFAYKLGLDPDVYDLEEGVGAELVKMNEHYANAVKTMFERVQGLVSQQYTERFDSVVSGLGDDWSDVFGKGSLDDIDRNSKAFKNRQRLDSEVRVIQQGRAKIGLEPLPLKEAIARAIRSEFADENKKIEAKKLNKQLKQKSRKTLARPAQNFGRQNMSGLQAALQLQKEFDSKLAENGY